MSEIREIILDKLELILIENGGNFDRNGTHEIYGENGKLNSLNLVRLIVEVENEIADRMGKLVVLTDDKALSYRNSPFRNVDALCDFVKIKLSEND